MIDTYHYAIEVLSCFYNQSPEMNKLYTLIRNSLNVCGHKQQLRAEIALDCILKPHFLTEQRALTVWWLGGSRTGVKALPCRC